MIKKISKTGKSLKNTKNIRHTEKHQEYKKLWKYCHNTKNMKNRKNIENVGREGSLGKTPRYTISRSRSPMFNHPYNGGPDRLLSLLIKITWGLHYRCFMHIFCIGGNLSLFCNFSDKHMLQLITSWFYYEVILFLSKFSLQRQMSLWQGFTQHFPTCCMSQMLLLRCIFFLERGVES